MCRRVNFSENIFKFDKINHDIMSNLINNLNILSIYNLRYQRRKINIRGKQ